MTEQDWTPEAKQSWYDNHGYGRSLWKFPEGITEEQLSGEDYHASHPDPVETLAEAELIGSSPIGLFHYPVIDIDLPIHVEESTTPGHYHLYIQRGLTWSRYLDILRAFEAAGIVQEGCLGASEAHEQSFVRLPWIKKESKDV